MLASKLLIQKVDEAGIELKYLNVTIQDGENSPCTQYGDWVDGKIEDIKKSSERSSRLVVKIVSGIEIDTFNLIANAREFRNFTNNSTDASCISRIQSKSLNELHMNNNTGYDNEYKKSLQNEGVNRAAIHIKNGRDINSCREQYFHSRENYLNPLEHSLEKVKENNARIMENIHMLNRTLNYTKKKEILDVVCPKSMRSFPCETCGKCFVYETGLRRHYSTRHAITEAQPRWQVVWTCIQCFQVWPRQDQALEHSNECCKPNNIDCVREIKTSSLLQCEFCEKVYTSIPRLLRHSKAHTTVNNYECNACGKAFMSYKIAEQHWALCPWLKMYYSFSLPKLLLCNACDRKFRNYDQLYNHRYKVGHFMAKTHCSYENMKAIGILVYQCEMCSKWFPSTNILKIHRSQYHPRHEIGMQCHTDQSFQDSRNYISAEKEYSLNHFEDNTHQDSK